MRNDYVIRSSGFTVQLMSSLFRKMAITRGWCVKLLNHVKPSSFPWKLILYRENMASCWKGMIINPWDFGMQFFKETQFKVAISWRPTWVIYPPSEVWNPIHLPRAPPKKYNIKPAIYRLEDHFHVSKGPTANLVGTIYVCMCIYIYIYTRIYTL